MNFNAENPPTSSIDILLVPAILIFFGVLIWFAAFNRVRLGEKAPWKWAAMLPLGFATFCGLMWTLRLRDPLYVQGIIGSRIVSAHWLALFVPLGLIVAMLVVETLMAKSQSRYSPPV